MYRYLIYQIILLLFFTVGLTAQTTVKVEKVHTLFGEGKKLPVRSVAISPDGSLVAAGFTNTQIHMWEMSNGQEHLTIRHHSRPVTAVTFSPDSKFLASSSGDKTVRIWDASNGGQIELINTNNTISALVFAADGKLLIGAGTDGDIYFWKLPGGKEVERLKGHTMPVVDLSLSNDGSLLASSGIDRQIIIWDVKSAAEVKRITDFNQPVLSAGFSADGSMLVSGDRENLVKIWDVETGELINSIKSHWDAVTSVRFSPIANFYASGSADNTVEFRTAPNGNKLDIINANNANVNSMCFSRDGSFLAVSNSRGAVVILKIDSHGDLALNVVNDSDGSRTVDANDQSDAKDNSGPSVTIIEPAIKRGLTFKVQEKTVLLKGKAEDPAGIFEITVNGEDAAIKENGEFYADVKLKVGENNIVVTAVDMFNNKVTETFVIERKMGTIIGPEGEDQTTETVAFGNYYGLFIGVEEYQDEHINPLDNPVSDAKSIMDVLTNRYSFDKENSIFLENPTRADILSALEELKSKTDANDNVLIFYAGHGYWDDDIQQGYWLPSDAMQNSRANWISNGDLRDNIRGINSAHTLLISDACFSGGIFRTRSAFNDAPVAIQEVYKLPSRKGMTSGTLTEVADESVFLKYLLKKLKSNTDTYITSEALFSSIRTAVLNNSKQVPQYGTIQNAGDEGGDFIFIRK